MTNDERALLLTMARLMRARISDEIKMARHFQKPSPRDDADFRDICDALKPFDPSVAPPVNEASVTATPAGKEKAGVRVEFWPDAIDMVNRIELIFWTDYDRYEQDCLFLSRGEASDLIEQLNRAIKELDAFLLAPPIAGKGETDAV